MQNRGLKDIFIACIDGLSGFPEAIETPYPKTQVQLCIVHLVRNALNYASYKDHRAVANDLKRIYRAVIFAEAERALWLRHWKRIITLFNYPEEIRRVIYTTNAIEPLNSVIRKATQNRRVFPTDRAALKVVYLAIERATKKWTAPIRDWKGALRRFPENNLPVNPPL